MQTKHTHDPWIVHYIVMILIILCALSQKARAQEPVPNIMGYSTTRYENGTVSIRSSLSPEALGLRADEAVFRDADHLETGVLFSLYKNDALYETKGALLSNEGKFDYSFQTDTLDTSRYRIEIGFYHDVNCVTSADDVLTCISAPYHNSTGDINARRVLQNYSDRIFADVRANCDQDTPTLSFHSLVWARDLPDHEYAESANTCPGLSITNCYFQDFVRWVLVKDGVVIATDDSHTIVQNGFRWDGTITVPAVPGTYQLRLQFNYTHSSGFLNLGPTVIALHDHYSEIFEITNPQSYCCQNKVITTTINASASDPEQAPDSIVALNFISGGASAMYHAGTVVQLKPGFHASSGSYFHASIEGCTGNFSKVSAGSRGDGAGGGSMGLVQHPESNLEQQAGNAGKRTVAGSLGKTEMAVYPNPSTGIFHVSVNTNHAKSIRVYDMVGDVVAEWDNTTDQDILIDISGYAKGVYFIQVRYDDQLLTEKLVHQ